MYINTAIIYMHTSQHFFFKYTIIINVKRVRLAIHFIIFKKCIYDFDRINIKQ